MVDSVSNIGPQIPEAYRNSPFHDDQGKLLLRKLFYEMTLAGEDKAKVKYTLKEFDHEGYPSLYKLYLAVGDPTEYQFATSYFHNFDHWERLTSTKWFAPLIAKWRKELELKIRSAALARLLAEGKSTSKNAFQANKYLLEKGWLEKDSKGRPSKDQVIAEAKRQAAETKVLDEDFLRIVGNAD